MDSMMEFPKTPLEFVESYKFKDSDEIYTNGSELIQVFRVKQMLEHYYEPLKEKATPKNPRGIKKDRCPICGSYNKVFIKRRNTVSHDIVYCWHCGNAIGLE